MYIIKRSIKIYYMNYIILVIKMKKTPKVLEFALYLASQVSNSTYEKIRLLLNNRLPTRRTLCR